MENLDKGLTVPKWVMINWPKILQMPQNSSGISMKKGFIGCPQSVIQSMRYNAIVCVLRKSQSNKLNEAHVCIPHITHVPSFSYHLSYTSACSKTISSNFFGGFSSSDFCSNAAQKKQYEKPSVFLLTYLNNSTIFEELR